MTFVLFQVRSNDVLLASASHITSFVHRACRQTRSSAQRRCPQCTYPPQQSEKILGSSSNSDVFPQLYIEMNRPYIEKNAAWMEASGRQDYLAMVNAPVYDNMTSPLPVDNDPRISSPIPISPGSVGFPSMMQDGYVVMRSPTNAADARNIFSPTRMSGKNLLRSTFMSAT